MAALALDPPKRPAGSPELDHEAVTGFIEADESGFVDVESE